MTRPILSFRVDAVPVAQPRQRQRVVTVGGRAMAMNYTPTKDKVNVYKAALQAAACQAMSNSGRALKIDQPLRVDLCFLLPRPKKLLTLKLANQLIPYSRKPDVDNFIKSTLDALNGIIWVDDSQVVEIGARKFYAPQDVGVGVTIEIWEVNQ